MTGAIIAIVTCAAWFVVGFTYGIDWYVSKIEAQAAEIERLNHANQELQSQNAKMREALKPFAELGFPYAVEAMGETE